MSSNYGNGLRSSRNKFVEPPSLAERLARSLPSAVNHTLDNLEATVQNSAQTLTQQPSAFWTTPSRWHFRRVLNVTNFFIALWIYTIWWGERLVFTRAVEACEWGYWEAWPSEATPHHVAFIADPQLVDPHTYPGRPWPLSSFTVAYTDQYMRRSYSNVQKILHPDTLYFLGDLFDGGREWATATSISPSSEYRKYGEDFWLREYRRFGDMFFGHWNDGGSAPGLGQKGRKINANLPGNHDLGFGNGIQEPVRARFRALFGEGNQVDTVGNHTFVSVDAVSLSAMDQIDPQTGSSGAGAGDGTSANGHLWKPVKEFLEDVRSQKARAVERDIRNPPSVLSAGIGYSENSGLFSHNVTGLEDTMPIQKSEEDRSQLYPTILLTHVPLYRAEGTPCGPLREHYPPSSDPPPDRDDRNAIGLHGGYQYQNVLTPTVTRDLITKIGNIAQVYSGDDHDYCEVVHREYTGAIREITVKSFSWAMGVDKPGFVLTSLCIPVHPNADPNSPPKDTIQNHLCILPDQLSIFIRYALLLALTLITLLIRAFIVVLGRHPTTPEPILPLSHSDEKTSSSRPNRPSDASSSSSNTSSTSPEPRLAPRSSKHAAGGGTSPSKLGGYGLGSSRPPSPSKPDNFGPTRHAHVAFDEGYDDYGMPSPSRARRKEPGGLLGVWREWTSSVRLVAIVAIMWYSWLIWHG